MALLVFAGSAMLPAQEQPQSSKPEEVIPLGPGYITKGYKTIVNGQVVKTTDGQEFAAPTMPAPNAPAAPTSSDAMVVTIIEGAVVDPQTLQPVTNLPAEVDLIPLGLRKLNTESGETLAPFFRVVDKNAPAQPVKPASQHPASMGPEGAPDFSALIESAEKDGDAEPSNEVAESVAETEPEELEEDSGGFFDFLFGEDEPEEGDRVVELDKPLTSEEMAALQNNEEFQDYLRKSSNTSRNFYSSKGRGGARNAPPKPPTEITIEEFDPEEWEVEGPTPPTPNIAIGKLVSVSADREIAVCWLQTRYLRPDRPMITRNYEMQMTGVLLPSGEQAGRAAGFWIADGAPNPGDEVIVPGPDYAMVVAPWINAPEED